MLLRRASIIGIGDSGEAHLLRLSLERLGLDVRLCLPGKPSDVFSGFDFHGQPADIAVIAAHGDAKGIVFPEMAAGIDELELADNRLTPELIRNRLKDAPPLVVSLACATGTDTFGDAFFAAGAGHYIAPAGDPDGRETALFLTLLCHQLVLVGAAVPQALEMANTPLEADSHFRVFTPQR